MRKEYPASRRRITFFEKFPGLYLDDPEDEFNDLISQLRTVTQNYFNKEEGIPNAKEKINEVRPS